jgi:hypothetical protein
MSRRESDREDLLREATALVERAEFTLADDRGPVVVGFRRDGSASFYFGSDPVFQFNTAGELRRAFIGGLLYKAERGRLVALRRERSESEVALVRSEISDEQVAAVLADLKGRLSRLHTELASGSFTLIGKVPADADVKNRIINWLAAVPATIATARAAGVR